MSDGEANGPIEPTLDSVPSMQQRFLGRTGLKVSRLGLGTLTWGRDTDEHEARDQLVAFAEAGGTLIDTAAGYGDGASEELIGSLIGDVVAREDVVIATKAGISRARGARETNTSRGFLISTLDASLKRLGVDHVDLWQVHTWVDDVPLEETLTALDYAVTTGEVFPEAVEVMTTLNRDASRAALEAGLCCATDVTGFGLLGHLLKLARASGVGAVIDAAAVPYLDAARPSLAAGYVPGGSRRNLDWVRPHVRSTVSDDELLLLADAQTSGGLLVAGELPGHPVIGELVPAREQLIEVR